MYELKAIREVVQNYARIISEIAHVDVEVVDSDLKRIAGSGIFSGNLGQDVSEYGHVYKEVIRTGKTIIVENPGEHELCSECIIRGNCRETYEISTPITIKGEIIGVLGMMAMSEKSRELIIDNKKSYLDFLAQIADFIGSKAHEMAEENSKAAMLAMLKIVTVNMDEGAIIINREGRIDTINPSAKKQLGIDRIIYDEPIKLRATGDTVSNSKEYRVRIGNKVSTVIGDIYDVPGDTIYSKVLLFRDLNKVQSNIYAMTATVKAMSTDQIIGSSKKTERLKAEIEKVAKSVSTVLITGESGTGKEVVATAIWQNSDRRDKRFVAINCAAIPETLLESELFGYVKGAFTGADPNGRIGKFELANHGVIFLDEIGDMPLYLQSKLLRVIQDKKVVRIGSNQQIPLDVRIIAATNKDLKSMIRDNKFREDLYYRLNVIPIDLPPLRERIEDMDELVNHFIEHYRAYMGKNFRCITDEAMKKLKAYSWPGNIRELENTVEFMVNMMENGVIDERTLPIDIIRSGRVTAGKRSSIRPLKELEREEIKRAIDTYGMNTEGKKKAADALGIGIATLYRHIKEMDLKI